MYWGPKFKDKISPVHHYCVWSYILDWPKAAEKHAQGCLSPELEASNGRTVWERLPKIKRNFGY